MPGLRLNEHMEEEDGPLVFQGGSWAAMQRRILLPVIGRKHWPAPSSWPQSCASLRTGVFPPAASHANYAKIESAKPHKRAHSDYSGLPLRTPKNETAPASQPGRVSIIGLAPR